MVQQAKGKGAHEEVDSMQGEPEFADNVIGQVLEAVLLRCNVAAII